MVIYYDYPANSGAKYCITIILGNTEIMITDYS